MANPAFTASVLSVSVTQSFVDACAQLLIQKHGAEGLHPHIVFVPNQRTQRSLREALASSARSGAVLLPHIIPTQHNSMATMLNLFAGNDAAIHDFLAIPPAMDEGTRISLFAKQVQASHPMVEQFAHLPKALGIAHELTALHDDIVLHRTPKAALEDAFGKQSVHNYADVLGKLFTIITQHWPQMAQAYGAISAAEHQAQLQACFIKHLPALAEQRCVYVMGSTGSVPAMRELMRAVSAHPCGQVMIPGAGAPTVMDEAVLHVNHTLDALHATTGDVVILGDTAPRAAVPAHAYEATTSEEEARLIALIIRKTLATSDARCLLITPDAQLMKRVAAHVIQAGITPNAPPLSLLLYTSAMQAYLAACTLISQPSHYLERALMEYLMPRDAAHTLAMETSITLMDKHALRNPRDRSFKALEATDDTVRDFVADIRAFSGRLAKMEGAAYAPNDWAGAIYKAAQACRHITFPELPEPVQATLAAYAPLGPIDAADMVHLLTDLGNKPSANPGLHPDSRVQLLTPVEARLTHADHVIFGSFHAGFWPRITEQNAWLGTKQRTQLGLQTPEDEFALAAHDVWLHASSARTISCTRAISDAGTLTQESPLAPLLTLAAGEADILYALKHHHQPAAITPLSPAEPNPPVAARPRHIRISALDTLMKDPYSIYAQYVLGLEPLDAYDTKADNREFGTLAHTLIQQIVTGTLAVDVSGEWAAREMARLHLNRGETVFWARRFSAIAAFAENLRITLDSGHIRFQMEETLTADYPLDATSILTLDGRADLIAHDGKEGASITDFKTGAPFTVSDMRDGKAAQLLGYAVLLELRGVDARTWRCLELPRIHKPEKLHEFSMSADDFSKRKSALNASLSQVFFEQTPFLSHPLYEEGVDSRRDEFDDISRIEEWG